MVWTMSPAQSAEYRRQQYETRKLQGICVQCGTNKARPFKVHCEECAAKKRVNDQRLATTPERIAATRRSRRKGYVLDKMCGFCPSCGCTPMPGKVYCAECYDEQRQCMERMYARRLADLIEANGGHCVDCKSTTDLWPCQESTRGTKPLSKTKTRKLSGPLPDGCVLLCDRCR